MTAEIAVLEHIVERQQQEVVDCRVKMKQMAVLMRVPRLHHHFIAKYGVFEFIQKCDRIVKENDYSRKRREARQAREQRRESITINRLSTR
jgi:hypothetical protein